MALQPTNNLPRNTNKKPQKTNYKVIVIVVAILLVFIVGMIISNSRSSSVENPYATESSEISDDSTITAPPTESVEPQPEWTYSEPSTITEIPVLSESSFSFDDNVFRIEDDFSFTQVQSLAENNSVDLGDYLSYIPAKSCIFKFSGNTLVVSHTSGAVLSIRRDKFVSDLDIDAMTAELKQHMANSHTSEVSIQTVYYSNYTVGVAATGIVASGDKMYNITLAYAYCSDGEMYTITAISDESASDFVELLMSGIRINNTPIVIN